MKFWSPKIQAEEKDWSVILHPLKGELDKKRIAERLSEIFHLSYEEARELVQSTPLILLDGLSHRAALRAKDIFQELRAEVALTREDVVKRRCYRAVWPENSDLSFLDREESELPKPAPVSQTQEITSPAPSAPPAEKAPVFSESLERLERKYQELERRYEQRTDELEEIKRNFERELREKAGLESSELRTSLQDWEERYQNLREEHQETKSIYEEKILEQKKEVEALKVQLRDLGVWQEKAAAFERELEGSREVLKRHEEKNLARERELFALREEIKAVEAWQEKAEGLGRQLEEQEKARMAYEEKIYGFERLLREQTDTVNLWREKYQSLAHKSERFEALYEEERKRRAETEETRRQGEEARRKMADETERTRIELEAQTGETEKWREKYQELEAKQKRLEEEFMRFTEEQNSEASRLHEANDVLGRELESAQRQVRELLARLEQLDLIEKRNRLITELSGKEARLRELALERERLRQEIQDRELRSQTIGGEQANLEREVLEVKQAQRHLLEQSKLREKNQKMKRPNHHQTPSIPQNLEGNELGVDNG